MINETLTIKDIACILLDAKPFRNTDVISWQGMCTMFEAVIGEKYSNRQDLLDSFREILGD